MERVFATIIFITDFIKKVYLEFIRKARNMGFNPTTVK